MEKDKPLPTFFIRVGGKGKIADYIISKIPPHKTYVEPFVGGGAVYLKKPLAEKNIINDIDKDIISLYKDLKHITKEDLENLKVDKSMLTKSYFEKLLKSKPTDPKNRFFRNILVSKLSFGGKRTSTAGQTLYIPQFQALKTHLDEYKNKISKTTVLSQDFRNVIKKYDNKDTFFYLDPPYSQNSKSLGYIKNLSPEELLSTLKTIKGKFIMSYDYSPEIVELFNNDFNVSTIKTAYTLAGNHNRQEKKEIIITNF